METQGEEVAAEQRQDAAVVLDDDHSEYNHNDNIRPEQDEEEDGDEEEAGQMPDKDDLYCNYSVVRKIEAVYFLLRSVGTWFSLYVCLALWSGVLPGICSEISGEEQQSVDQVSVWDLKTLGLVILAAPLVLVIMFDILVLVQMRCLRRIELRRRVEMVCIDFFWLSPLFVLLYAVMVLRGRRVLLDHRERAYLHGLLFGILVSAPQAFLLVLYSGSCANLTPVLQQLLFFTTIFFFLDVGLSWCVIPFFRADEDIEEVEYVAGAQPREFHHWDIELEGLQKRIKEKQEQEQELYQIEDQNNENNVDRVDEDNVYERREEVGAEG